MTVEDIVKAVEDLPQDIDALDAIAQQIMDLYQALREEAGDEPTDAQIEELERLAESLTKVKAARASAEKAEADEASLQAERQARVESVEEAFATEETEAAAEAVEDTEAVAEAAVEDEPVSEAVEATETVSEAAVEEKTVADEAPAQEPVKKEYSVTKNYGGKVKSTDAAAAESSPFSLDAAAPGYRSGSVDMIDLATAFNAMSSGRSIVSHGNGVTTSAQFGHISRNIPSELTGNDEASLMAAVDSATNEQNLDGNSLVAAGGWCAPSETIYSFLPTTPATGLFSLPEIGIARGGLRFPIDPDFSALYDATKFHMSEAEAISGRTKECIEIPCADMEEVRLDVLWTCITSNLLSNKGWPELTAKFLAEAVKGHLHRLSAARLSAVLALSDAVLPGVPTLGTVGTILNAVELHAEDLRLKYRLGNGATIEGIAPDWLRPVLRADLAYRDGVLPEDVSNARLDAYFADRGVRFQYVADYQTTIIGSGAVGLTYPEHVDVVLYPAGTFFSAVENVINLGVTYDSAGLSKNQRTEMFIEDGYAVGKRAYESRVLKLPISVDGKTGLRAAVGAAEITQGGGAGKP